MSITSNTLFIFLFVTVSSDKTTPGWYRQKSTVSSRLREKSTVGNRLREKSGRLREKKGRRRRRGKEEKRRGEKGKKEIPSAVLAHGSPARRCHPPPLFLPRDPDKSSGTIKEQLAAIAPLLEQLCKQKEDRIKEFADVQLQIEKIRGEIAGTSIIGGQMGTPTVDEEDLSLKKLDEYQQQLQELQKEKVPRHSDVAEFILKA
ncbi:hypothetical protein GW17_00001651 [Ensete ventricosum]|nr:hypothetical protein GW17_00001651 [Ensete ventricosum]